MNARHTLSALALAAAAVFAALPAHAGVYIYNAILDGRQEPTPTASTGKGAGRFVIDTDSNTVTYRITYAGLSGAVAGGHIHGSATSFPGTNGAVLHTFASLGNAISGTWTYLEAQEPMLLAGTCYANLHTAASPGGEIRGQIMPFNAQLDNTQENPATASTGSGWCVATVDTAANTLTYWLNYSGLSGPVTSAHLHGNTLHGTNAGVKVGITAPAPGVIGSGTISYSEADQFALLQGQWYVNLHTAAFGGGEIRGQLVPTVVPIDGGQEVPATTPVTSSGFGMVAVDSATATLSYDVRVVSLGAETAAHIHGYSTAGVASGVVNTLAPGAQKKGTWAYGAPNTANVLGGLTYFNVHTSANGGGEIRGQILGLPRQNTVAVTGVGGGPRLTSGLAAAPNPFGPRTALTFSLSRTGRVAMSVVGVDGRLVREFPEATFAPGNHTFDWDGLDNDGRSVGAGVYFVVVRRPEGTQTTRLARLR